ncbi:cell death abnormality protein 1-like [Microplitis mediator]|uniref:cell death abnormality protein 1-like n=1 Tax=Microplitis mediator TaxID=375433 RepID=UPI00255574FD|nr:cell death abnormality protein 1-like [Microplitis mediator]
MKGHLFLMSSKIIFIIILHSANPSSGNEDDSSFQCARYGENCDPYQHFSCCDKSDICKRTSSNFICKKKAELGDYCINSNDCIHIPHAGCLLDEHKCVCYENYNITREGICAPTHGGVCSDKEKCAQQNLECINEICQCKPYHVFRDTECVTRELGESCDDHSDCYGVEFAICSEDGKCICHDNYIPKDGSMCASILGRFCYTNEQCGVHHSICIENKCECAFGYIADSNMRCVRRSLGKICELNSDCDHLKNSRCSLENECVCNDNNFANNQMGCEPVADGYCNSNKQCQFPGFHCVDNKCQCKPNFSLQSVDNCVEKCSEPWHTVCSKDKKCVCKSNNIAINRSTCLPILDGYCWKDDQCRAANSVCFDFRCRCKPYYTAVSKNTCLPQ